MISNKERLNRILDLEREEPLGSPARFSWAFKRKSFREKIKTNSGNLDSLFFWPATHESLLTGYTKNAIEEHNLLDARHKVVTVDPAIGDGYPATKLFSLSEHGQSGSFIRQALVCQYLEQLSGLAPKEWQSIFEFGGGYGALACVASRLGFAGKHVIYDFPELHLIQQWFISKAGVDAEGIEVEYIGPSQLFSHTPEEWFFDFFLSICSLDEAPIKLRRDVLGKVNASFYFIWYTKAFDGVDNDTWVRSYFEDEMGLGPECLTIIDPPHANQRILYART